MEWTILDNKIKYKNVLNRHAPIMLVRGGIYHHITDFMRYLLG